MPGNFRREDIRVLKTQKALKGAMFALLRTRRFEKITVNDLCNEALVSRAAFYTHFADKYDLLRTCLADIREQVTQQFLRAAKSRSYAEMDAYIGANENALANLAQNANGELLEILFQACVPNIALSEAEQRQNRMSAEHQLLSAFCSGGLVHLMLWHAANKPVLEVRSVAEYLHNLMRAIMDWDEKRNRA
ncbi:MAG: TetR/AcrR family transcriptional regulator [Oscillospiraceae bacterium]|jgi:AcrR family transcriptional regulator|nr:TetR/AcrR family transcriptional regulator [Oscillospiraceae bacterium]